MRVIDYIGVGGTSFAGRDFDARINESVRERQSPLITKLKSCAKQRRRVVITFLYGNILGILEP